MKYPKQDVYWCSECFKHINYPMTEKFEEHICPKCNKLMRYDETQILNDQMTWVVEHIIDPEKFKCNPPSEKDYSIYTPPVVVKCPYCSSTNTKKIGVISRSMSLGLFGLGSGKVGKQWHCNKCNSNF